MVAQTQKNIIMNLTLFFRLILMSIFQLRGMSSLYKDEPMSYDNQYFYCPSVYANDGFHVSLQINNGNYCESINGYRTLGHTMLTVEFGFPSMNEELMFQYSEMWNTNDNFNVTNTVGRIPISILEEVFEKHGGIDWEKTISIDAFNKFIAGV
jgi:hypothetical protein